MFDSGDRLPENKYTVTIALLLMAFVFSPAILLVSRPVGVVSMSVAGAGSLLCIALARLNWKRYSELPSIQARPARTR